MVKDKDLDLLGLYHLTQKTQIRISWSQNGILTLRSATPNLKKISTQR